MDTIGNLFEKLKKAHQFYVSGDNDYQARLLAALVPTFEKLETLGVDRSFSESLVIWGKEFVDSLPKNDEKTNTAQILLNPMSRIFRHENSGPLTNEVIETLFYPSKVEKMTENEERCSKLATKYGLQFYRILSKEGEAPKIQDIPFIKKNKK